MAEYKARLRVAEDARKALKGIEGKVSAGMMLLAVQPPYKIKTYSPPWPENLPSSE
jgi:hypothetical protein